MEEKPRQDPAVAHVSTIFRHGEVKRELCDENHGSAEYKPYSPFAQRDVADNVLETVCDFIET